MPVRTGLVASPPALREVRTHRLLRQLAGPACIPARGLRRTSHRDQLRTGRRLVLRLRTPACSGRHRAIAALRSLVLAACSRPCRTGCAYLACASALTLREQPARESRSPATSTSSQRSCLRPCSLPSSGAPPRSHRGETPFRSGPAVCRPRPARQAPAAACS